MAIYHFRCIRNLSIGELIAFQFRTTFSKEAKLRFHYTSINHYPDYCYAPSHCLFYVQTVSNDDHYSLRLTQIYHSKEIISQRSFLQFPFENEAAICPLPVFPWSPHGVSIASALYCTVYLYYPILFPYYLFCVLSLSPLSSNCLPLCSLWFTVDPGPLLQGKFPRSITCFEFAIVQHTSTHFLFNSMLSIKTFILFSRNITDLNLKKIHTNSSIQ